MCLSTKTDKYVKQAKVSVARPFQVLSLCTNMKEAKTGIIYYPNPLTSASVFYYLFNYDYSLSRTVQIYLNDFLFVIISINPLHHLALLEHHLTSSMEV